ncbi:718_t:CDS:2 [Funneliformis mosseae]|uniref:718_t:CDS:1 n=1 Tax=Funneliformis mosseae TaxID=27381 RepID=A0A9N9N9B5_FUNMO|nr:718_t:CDS:2 [Funneliformis mosseae]
MGSIGFFTDHTGLGFYQGSRPLDGIDRFLPKITQDWTSIKNHDHLMVSSKDHTGLDFYQESRLLDGFFHGLRSLATSTKDHDHLMGSKVCFHGLRSSAASTKDHDLLMDHTRLDFYQGSLQLDGINRFGAKITFYEIVLQPRITTASNGIEVQF